MNNPPAFPRTGEGFGDPKYDTEGMTLRDYFAAAAINGLVATDWYQGKGMSPQNRAAEAYVIADAMLKAREQ